MSTKYGSHWWWVSFFAQFLSQHVTETLLTAPLLFLLRDSSLPTGFDTACAFFAILFLLGAYIADDQLREFVAGGQFDRSACLTTGLWAYSRNPNYVFECFFHWAVAIWSLRVAPVWILIGPAFNTFVLIVSAILKERHLRSGPRAKAFKEYCKHTRMFF
jgi:steroid 5-alpha reductase family enzyme